MSGEWKDVKLEDVADEITVGYVGSMASEYVDRGIPFLRSQNIEPLRINKKDLKYITPEFHHRIRKSRLAPGDVVIVRTGKPGSCSVIPSWFSDGNCSDLVIVRCGESINNHFLAYYINTAATHHVSSHVVGAVQQHFNVGAARTLRIRLPPLAEQKRIAHILGTLDEKIELNRRINATLEAMARALFQSWFVDEIREELPKGWSAGTVEDIASLSRGTVSPAKFPEETFSHYSLPAFDNGRIPAEDCGADIKSNKTLIPDDSVLISKLNPRIPRIWLPSNSRGNRAISSTEFLVVVPKEGVTREFLYCLLSSESFMNTLVTMVTGTSGSHQRIRPENLLSMPTVIPSKAKVHRFNETVGPLLQKIQSNIDQSQKLATLRDTLLPKLLSGEVAVPTIPELSHV